jgi:hypothetical protein
MPQSKNCSFHNPGIPVANDKLKNVFGKTGNHFQPHYHKKKGKLNFSFPFLNIYLFSL